PDGGDGPLAPHGLGGAPRPGDPLRALAPGRPRPPARRRGLLHHADPPHEPRADPLRRRGRAHARPVPHGPPSPGGAGRLRLTTFASGPRRPAAGRPHEGLVGRPATHHGGEIRLLRDLYGASFATTWSAAASTAARDSSVWSATSKPWW